MQTWSTQDTFLPHVENGTITLIGATTENPSFQLNNALLSRCRVIVLEKLSTEHVEQILKHALDSLGVFTTKRDSLDTSQVHLSSEYRWGFWIIWKLWYCVFLKLVKPGSHMLPTYLRHGRWNFLGCDSDMRTEVASNIGYLSLNRCHSCKFDLGSTS